LNYIYIYAARHPSNKLTCRHQTLSVTHPKHGQYHSISLKISMAVRF
jgi:hypothetical protein